jgi:hypothetical protein
MRLARWWLQCARNKAVVSPARGLNTSLLPLALTRISVQVAHASAITSSSGRPSKCFILSQTSSSVCCSSVSVRTGRNWRLSCRMWSWTSDKRRGDWAFRWLLLVEVGLSRPTIRESTSFAFHSAAAAAARSSAGADADAVGPVKVDEGWPNDILRSFDTVTYFNMVDTIE